jgi:cyclomaltodextrinase
MEQTVIVAPGIYQHFKGTLYEVLCTATHSETGETLVVYREVSPISKVWARPIQMWYDDVGDPMTGFPVSRFTPVHDTIK